MRDKKIDDYLIKYLRPYIDIDEKSLEDVVSRIPVKEFKKGSMLLYQGEPSKYCLFVIKGCLRQYRINEAGDEVTSEFYEEGQWVNVFNESIEDQVSKYSITCIEDSLLVYSESDRKSMMFELFPSLLDMTNLMLGEKIGEINESMYSFAALSSEERVKELIKNRPSLLTRVPQHQLASYLGITQESFSRIKKRIR